jgi:integrase
MKQAAALKRGDGRVFLRGKVWWIAYFAPGSDGGAREYRESSGSTDERRARRLLRERQREAGNARVDGKTFQAPKAEKLTMAELLNALMTEYEFGEKPIKSLRQQKSRERVVREFFGHRRALSITPAVVRQYIAERRAGKLAVAVATINRELALLRRAFSLAVKERRLAAMPPIPSAGREDNIRRGFLSPAEVSRITDQMDPVTAAITRFAFRTAWRASEVRLLSWERVDRAAREVRLFTSKSGRPRVLPLDKELAELIEAAWTARHYTRSDGTSAVSGHVFHDAGRPLTESVLAKRWAKARKAAGMPTVIFHDLRRSGIRLLVRSGVRERVAMDVSGHVTRSVFDRYDISDGADVLHALNLQAAFIATQTETNVAEFKK